MDEDCSLISAQSDDHFLSRDLHPNLTRYSVEHNMAAAASSSSSSSSSFNLTLLMFLFFVGNSTPSTATRGGDPTPTPPVTFAFYLDDKDMPQFTDMSLVKTVVLSAMFVIALVGNVATFLRMYQIRKRHSTINLLIMHLTVADLIVTFFCNVTDAVWSSTVQWYAGNVACKVVKFLQVFGLYSSTYVIVIISVDRCLAILDPISKNKAPGRVRTMITVAWGLSAFFSLPQTYIFRVERAPFRSEFHQCVTYGAYSAQWQEQLYSALSLLLMFVIPLTTMIVAYALIFYTIARKSRDFQHEYKGGASVDTLSRGPVRSQLLCKAKVKSLRMTAVIVLAFIVCWTPYQVMFIVYTFVGETNVDNRYVMWIFFCGMANSMVNPLIYGAFHACGKTRKVRKTLEPRQMRLPTPPHCSSQSSTSKMLRHYLGKIRVPLAAKGDANNSYPMAMLIRNHNEADDAMSSQF